MYTLTQQEKKSRALKHILLGVFSVALVSFVGMELYPFIHGPQLSIETISDGTTLTEPLVSIKGRARYTKDLLVNGNMLPTAPDGTFNEQILLNQGYNVINISARDRFGALTNTTYRLMLHENEQQTLTLNVLSQGEN